MSLKTLKTPVLIVGSGPVGLTLNLLLSRMRIPSILIEKKVLPRNHPRAHYLSNRTMEIWRQLGNFDKAMECVLEPMESWRYFKYCRHLIDPHLNLYAVVDHFSGNAYSNANFLLDHYKYKDTYYDDLSPSRIANFPQHKFLYFLKSLALERSQVFEGDESTFRSWLENEYKLALSKFKIEEKTVKKFLSLERPFNLPTLTQSDPNFNFRTFIPFVDGGLKFERFLKKGDYIMSRVKDMRDGSEMDIKSLFVVGTDGIHSRVAQELFGSRDINSCVKDTSNLRDTISVHFESKKLGEIVSSNPSLLYFIFSQCICVLVCQGGNPPEFVMQIPIFPELEPEQFFNEQNCALLINEAVGAELDDLRIIRINKWTVTTNVQPSFIDKETCKIFLAGDAAHLVAPAGGLGMNMGIADAYNLAWRISRVFYSKSLSSNIFDFNKLLDVIFKDGLSDSDREMLNEYSLERHPIAEYTRDVCLNEVENGSKFAKKMLYNLGNFQIVLDLISPIVKNNSQFFQLMFNSLKTLMKYVYNSPKRMDVISKFSKGLFYNQGFLGLLFPGCDLAYSYNGISFIKKLILDGNLKTSKSYRRYMPQTPVGLRIPHYYFYSTLNSNVYKISTVDLPSLVQPPIFNCILLFNENIMENVINEINLNLYYICLWETGNSVGSGSFNVINDQFLSKPNYIINKIGLINTNVCNDMVDHFIFNKLENIQDYNLFNKGLEYVSKMRKPFIKRVFSNKRILDNFSATLFGKKADLNNCYIILRPDGHILSVKYINNVLN